MCVGCASRSLDLSPLARSSRLLVLRLPVAPNPFTHQSPRLELLTSPVTRDSVLAAAQHSQVVHPSGLVDSCFRLTFLPFLSPANLSHLPHIFSCTIISSRHLALSTPLHPAPPACLYAVLADLTNHHHIHHPTLRLRPSGLSPQPPAS